MISKSITAIAMGLLLLINANCLAVVPDRFADYNSLPKYSKYWYTLNSAILNADIPTIASTIGQVPKEEQALALTKAIDQNPVDNKMIKKVIPFLLGLEVDGEKLPEDIAIPISEGALKKTVEQDYVKLLQLLLGFTVDGKTVPANRILNDQKLIDFTLSWAADEPSYQIFTFLLGQPVNGHQLSANKIPQMPALRDALQFAQQGNAGRFPHIAKYAIAVLAPGFYANIARSSSLPTQVE
ncbi:hypothetical protein M1466_01090 [Candidatus Dependentiae bacterium]|nr:hypothetical protein [Candidatus Dependentiae bacterium]